MHIYVYESAQNVSMPLTSGPVALPSTKLSTPLFRPRLEGQRGALRGDAYSARLADSAKVLFTVRLPAGSGDLFNNYRAILTVFQSPLLGQNPETVFPSTTKDVTGYFAVEGQIVLDISLYAVNRVQLELTRVTNPPGPPPNSVSVLFTLVQVLAEENAVDIEKVLHDRGET
jgi:hypothetical protein